jgi:hypothetical protein
MAPPANIAQVVRNSVSLIIAASPMRYGSRDCTQIAVLRRLFRCWRTIRIQWKRRAVAAERYAVKGRKHQATRPFLAWNYNTSSAFAF